MKHDSTVVNNFGFSLVEVMLAISLLAGVSMGVMKLNQSMNKTTKSLDQQMDGMQLAARIQNTLRDSEACHHTFSDVTIALNGPATVPAAGIRSPTNTEVIKVGNVYGKITVEAITFQRVDAPGTAVLSIDNPSSPGTSINVVNRTARIRVQLRKGTTTSNALDHQNTIGALQFYQHFEVGFQVAESNPNDIVTCSSEDAEYVSAACDSLSGTIDDGLCRSLTIYALDATPGPQNSMAATFYGNVSIDAWAPGGANGILSVNQNLIVGGNSTLGNNSADNTYVHGDLVAVNRLCLTDAASGNCITTWFVGEQDCYSEEVTGIGNIDNSWKLQCNPDFFTTGMQRLNGTNRITMRCCKAKVR